MTAQRIDGGSARGADPDIGFLWSLAAGVGMIIVALLGFAPNPLVGVPSSAWGTPLFLTGNTLDVIHLVTGALLLYGALGLTVRPRAGLLVIIGICQLVLVLLGCISGDLFGAVRYHTSALDQLVLLAVACISIGVGYLGLGGSVPALRRGPPPDAGPTPTE